MRAASSPGHPRAGRPEGDGPRARGAGWSGPCGRARERRPVEWLGVSDAHAEPGPGQRGGRAAADRAGRGRLGRLFADAGPRALPGRRQRPRRPARPAGPRPRLHHLRPPGRRRGAAAAASPARCGRSARSSAPSAARSRTATTPGSWRSPPSAPTPTPPTAASPGRPFGDTLDGDLVRRDFTVNAMAVSVPDHRFVDPYGGLADLAAGVLRTPGTPEDSFSDDPLRMMRAARFAAQLRLHPGARGRRRDDGDGRPDRHHLGRAGPRRAVQAAADRPAAAGLDLLVRTGLADRVLPELPALRLERDEHHRHKDVYEHSLTVLDQAIELETRLATPAGPGQPAGRAAARHRQARDPDVRGRAARSPSTTTTWSGPSWSASG